ncbi:MFS transporter [bacterium]|nr:MFS transporter [bacterium]
MQESPLRIPLFRMLWIATLVSNVGTWMQEVANAWLMTTLAPDPLMVSLVQGATTLPMFLLALPAGALADVLDRRRLLLATQTWMMVAAAVMAALTMTQQMTPWLLLLCTFYLAVGTALNSPGWHAITPEIVPKEALPAAVTLNGLAINCARAIGPGLGGLVVVWLGPGAAFLLNAVSFLAVVFVLLVWKRNPRGENLPAERFLSAMRVGVQHVRHSPVMLLVLWRAGVFIFTSSALWAVLPLLCKQEYAYGAREYGAMLVLFGVGAIVSATTLLPRLRVRLEVNQIVSRAWLAYIPFLLTLATATHYYIPFLAMLWGGGCSICLLSSFHLAAQSVSPAWVRARAMSVYLLTFFGAASSGSLFWGYLARGLGIRQCLLASAGLLLVGTVTAWLAPLRTGETFDHEPSHHWPDPDIALEVPLKHGPIMVAVEYDIATQDSANFIQAMEKIRRIRYRNGVLRWGLYVDLANPTLFREVYLEESWAAHLRQHERVTTYEAEVAQHAYNYHRGESSPLVFHYGYCDETFPGRTCDGPGADLLFPTNPSGVPLWFLD